MCIRDSYFAREVHQGTLPANGLFPKVCAERPDALRLPRGAGPGSGKRAGTPSVATRSVARR
eukprot:9802744-Alexandrium_andersonii.AAC.1